MWLAVALTLGLVVVLPAAARAGVPGIYHDRAEWSEEGAPAYWAREIIDDAIRYEFFTGYPRGTVEFDLGVLYGDVWPESRGAKVKATLTPEFRPMGTITRAEFATILARATGFEEESDSRAVIPFRDVAADAWYRPYVTALHEKNVVRLVDRPGDKFYGDEPITRVEIAAWAARAADAYGVVVGPAPLNFTDSARIVAMWRQDVGQAVTLGIVRGYEDGSFRPDGTATRAEAAAMVLRLLGHFKKNLPTVEELVAAIDAGFDAWNIWSRNNPKWSFAVSDWQRLLAKWYMPGSLTWWHLSKDQPCTVNNGSSSDLYMICEQVDVTGINDIARTRWTNPLSHFAAVKTLSAEVEAATDRTARVRLEGMGVPVTLDGNRSLPQGKGATTIYLRNDGGRWKYASEAGYSAGEVDHFDPQLASRLDGKTLSDIP